MVSRSAGPVCITRLAMRPAKSFWKNAHDLAHHVPVVCQRIRLVTLAAIAWLASRFCVTMRERPRDQQHDRHAEPAACQCSANSVARRRRRHQRDDAADENRNRRVEQRDDEAGDEQRGEQALGLAREVPIERRAARPAAPGRFGRLTVGFSSRSNRANIVRLAKGSRPRRPRLPARIAARPLMCGRRPSRGSAPICHMTFADHFHGSQAVPRRIAGVPEPFRCRAVSSQIAPSGPCRTSRMRRADR